MEVNRLITYVFSTLEFKTVRNVALCGETFSQYLTAVVEGVNQKRIPHIDSIASRILTGIQESLLERFKEEVGLVKEDDEKKHKKRLKSLREKYILLAIENDLSKEEVQRLMQSFEGVTKESKQRIKQEAFNRSKEKLQQMSLSFSKRISVAGGQRG